MAEDPAVDACVHTCIVYMYIHILHIVCDLLYFLHMYIESLYTATNKTENINYFP